MQMDRMLHHRVVDQDEAHPLSKLQFNWIGAGEFLSVESPDESLHVAGEMNFDVATRRPRIDAAVAGTQVGIGQDAASVAIESVPRLRKSRPRSFGDIVHLRTLVEHEWFWRDCLSRGYRR